MPIPDAQKVVIQQIVKATLAAAGGANVNVQTTFHYRRVATVIAPNKASFNTVFAANVYAPMLAAFNVGYANGTSNLRWINDAQDPTRTITLAGLGAIATDRSSSFNAVYMNLRTAIRGKRYRGAKHFAAVNEIDTLGDVLTGAGLARWQTVQAAMLLQLTDGDGNVWNPCIVSGKPLSQIKTNPTVVVFNDITEVILDLTLGTMRRRKVRTVI